MKRMLFNATYAEELRVAAVEGQKLINFDIETSSKEQRRGNIYKGFITRVEPSLEACFVDYGTEKQGFLPFKEIDYRYLPEINGQKTREFSKLPLGTELIVQVEKDERGNKGAALTSYVTLPGRYLVLMPNNSRAGGISRRIEGEERDELKSVMAQLEVPHGMSVILRTAALGRVIEELQWDLTYLLKLWSAIRAAAEEQGGSFLIYQESSLVIRSIRDHFSPDIAEVLIDTEDVYNQARQFMAHVMPNFADRIKLYRDDVPLFSRFQIEHQIESAYARTVNLPSGGAIVIDHTEALTSVDVNSAKANKGADIEATAFATNLEAAEEIARQLRLRDLGGLVVVDFIDMENARNQRELENHFKNQLGYDRARIQMGKLSKFGLLELSRQRLQASLDESSSIACPRCAGVGTIRGIESSALHVLRIVQEETIKNGHHLSALHVQLPVDVATYLLNERRDDVAKIEARMKVKIVLIPNVHLDSPNYKIKKISYENYDSNFSKSSYNLVEIPEETLGYKSVAKKTESGTSKLPVVPNISPSEPAPMMEVKKSKSLFSSLVEKIGELFASKPATPAKNNKPNSPRTAQQAGRNVRMRNENRSNNSERNVSERPSRASGMPERGNNPINSTNKTRPVPISKSDNKIQTVRPAKNNETQVTSSAAAAPVPSRAERPERSERSNRNERQTAPRQTNVGQSQNKAASSRQDSSTNGTPQATVRNEESYQRPQRRAAEPSPIAEVAVTTSTDKLNIADKSPIQQTIFASGVSGGAVATVIHNTQDAVAESSRVTEITISQEVVVAEAHEEKKQVVVAPIVFEPVDLGSLQMVGTKAELIEQLQPEVILESGKRYSDLVIEEKVIDPNINYELIETKR
ncbi:MAG: Rne/Rng family ribonuclease [Neisseriaceae bacterium]|nr:MAG: Rne/Rng family ribonuclease [Neisseriaceae bacterium]